MKELAKASKKDVMELSLFEDEKVKAFGDFLISILKAAEPKVVELKEITE